MQIARDVEASIIKYYVTDYYSYYWSSCGKGSEKQLVELLEKNHHDYVVQVVVLFMPKHIEVCNDQSYSGTLIMIMTE